MTSTTDRRTYKLQYHADPGDFLKGWDSYPVAVPQDDPDGFFAITEEDLDRLTAEGSLICSAEEIANARTGIRDARAERNLPSR